VDSGSVTRTPLYACPYLPSLQARQRAFLASELDPEVYHDLMDRGFRRNGEVFYAMDCPTCCRCIPLRLAVERFVPSKSQRRAWRRNEALDVRVQEPQYSPAKFELYRRYVAAQHAPTDDTEEQFRGIYTRVVDTVEVLYVLGDRTLAVSLLDVCSRSVSAVYHFFDPDHRARSLGVFSVLAEIEWTRRLGVPYYYLGYWVEGAKTMHYKANYRPHELWRGGAWQPA
jgi:arginine-tRNA-protein transferase